MIKLTDIVKNYPDGEGHINRVLRWVSLEVKENEFVAIKGPSGSGKTTLLSILGTLLAPDAGTYLLNGVNIFDPAIDRSLIRNREIGFVFQDHRLMPQYNALENILLPVLAWKSAADKPDIAYARRLMELTGITHTAGQYPSTLSGGEASRAALCRALVMKPLLVLADEPTGQLDAENARNIAAMLAEINQTLKTTIVMVTHSDEVSATAHRILTLKEGELK